MVSHNSTKDQETLKERCLLLIGPGGSTQQTSQGHIERSRQGKIFCDFGFVFLFDSSVT